MSSWESYFLLPIFILLAYLIYRVGTKDKFWWWARRISISIAIIYGLLAIGINYNSDPLLGYKKLFSDVFGLMGLGETFKRRPSERKPIPAAITAEYKPGWQVQLHTASFADGKMNLDPGIVGAYLETGPVFSQETFVKQFLGESTGLQQNIAGVASSQFHALTEGTYQFGVRIQAPSNIICHATLALPENNAALRELKDLKVPGIGTWFGASAVQLSAGYHDVKLIFGCEAWYMDYIFKKSAPALKGDLTIYVMHPDEPAAVTARAEDFVRAVTSHSQDTPPSPPR